MFWFETIREWNPTIKSRYRNKIFVEIERNLTCFSFFSLRFNSQNRFWETVKSYIAIVINNPRTRFNIKLIGRARPVSG